MISFHYGITKLLFFLQNTQKVNNTITDYCKPCVREILVSFLNTSMSLKCKGTVT